MARGQLREPEILAHHLPACRHIAAEAGDLEMMQLLVERGAALDLRDTSGSTPLHLALEAQVGKRGGLELRCCMCRDRTALPAA